MEAYVLIGITITLIDFVLSTDLFCELYEVDVFTFVMACVGMILCWPVRVFTNYL